MSDRRWRKWELIGLFVTLIFGNLLHFVYDWSGKNRIVAAFAATNESTWEHMKLLVIPWVVWSLVEAIALRENRQPVLLGAWVSWRILAKGSCIGPVWSAVGLLLLLGVWALAVWWTYDPPQLPLFTDPITGQTGLFAGKE